MTTPLLWVIGSTLFLVCIAGLLKLWQLAKFEDAKRDDTPDNDAAISADLARRRQINREQIAQQEKGR